MGACCSWGRETGIVIRLTQHSLTSAITLKKLCAILAPHPDDDILGCGGIIAARIAEKLSAVHVFILTDGRNSHKVEFGITRDPTPDKLSAIRKTEAISALKVLGVPLGNIHFLGFEDGCLAQSISQAVSMITSVLSPAHFCASEIFAPHEEDQHTDHKAASVIAMKLFHRLNSCCCVHKYIIWKPLGFDHAPSLRFDISNFVLLKVSAMSYHKSQITKFSNQQPRPVLDPVFLDSFLANNFEMFYK